MDFFDVISSRHSVRAYKPDAVEPEKLDKILDAGRLAPTACNLQAFKILVVDTRKLGREKIKIMFSPGWLADAPLLLAVCSVPASNWVRRADGKNYSDVDAAIVMDYMILAAAALGLGTCWIGAFNPDAAREVLELEAGWEPVALTPLGYSAETAVSAKRRKQPDELVIIR